MENSRQVARGAQVVWWVATTAIAAGLVLNVVNQQHANAGLTPPVGHDIVFSVWAAAYATVGALIAVRKPGNVVGWLLLAGGLVLAVSSLMFEYANWALAPRHAPGGTLALWIAQTPSTLFLILISLALLVFPDGRLPGPRWRPVVWLSGVGCACLLIGLGLLPGSMDSNIAVENPIGVGETRWALNALQVSGWIVTLVLFAAAGTATVVRLRRSSGATRQQMKWVSYAAAVLGVVWTQWTVMYLSQLYAGLVADIELVVTSAAIAGVPIAMGIAILRYRLYEIDVIIRKTLVYTVLVAALSVVYIGGVAVLSEVLRTVAGESGAMVVTLSTLGVAAAFQPLRRRIQHVVDHRFYRDRYDTTRIADQFNQRMREQIDLDALRGELLSAITTTLQPSSVTLWMPPAQSSGPSQGRSIQRSAPDTDQPQVTHAEWSAG